MIYYVEDDQAIRNLVLYALTAQHLDVRGFTNASDFKAVCIKEPPDLVLLDIMLPGEDGLSILAWIRNSSQLRQLPVMMLTAKGSEYDKVLALDSGADDYLAKPFGMMELTSRCKALLRRPSMSAECSQGADDTVAVGLISLSARDHRAFAGDVELDLTLKEFELLRKLMDSPGQAFTRARLLEDIWGITFVGSTRTLDTHIQTLRRKLNNACAGIGDSIETVRGVGYRLAREEKP
ncbi:MAG: response regulator transcription factor [Atopobiaceae bacterium]|nr:response regulator transcription factor [Atopobiaceae bacterium]